MHVWIILLALALVLGPVINAMRGRPHPDPNEDLAFRRWEDTFHDR